MKTLLTILALTIAACSAECGVQVHSTSDDALATAIGHALVRACPIGDDPADARARDACADKLGALSVLAAAQVEPFIWGGQQAGYALERGTTRFNARVWRRLYASTFMYGRDFTVERVGAQTILHMPVTFRGAMPAGEYPYPFWHSTKKWDAYSYATTMHLVIEGGRVLGVLRGAAQDPARPKTSHTWDGAWGTPRAALFAYALSAGNPHALALDLAYRALEARMREHGCDRCHAPDNKGKADQLELLVYPAQALAGRHDIVAQVADESMPPARGGADAGIADLAARETLLGLARAFADAGDAALAWEVP